MPLLASNPVLAVIFFIGFLVFIHETGHFLVGKLCGIGVEIYSIGFGPRIFGFSHKGTAYQLCLLPLGGFVKFAGALRSEEVEERFKGKEMFRASPFARAATILAGPMANLILAATIFSIHGFRGIEHPPATIGSIQPGGAADHAGLLPGDEILKIGPVQTFSWDDLRTEVSMAQGKSLPFVIKRKGQELSFHVTPELQAPQNDEAEGDLGDEEQRGAKIGVSYGMIPAIVSPLIDIKNGTSKFDSNIIVSGAKLVAGEHIEKLSFPTSADQKLTKSYKINSWADALSGFEAAFKAKTDTITIELSPFINAESPQKAKSTSRRTLEISTKNWESEAFLAKLNSVPGAFSRQLKLAEALGLGDSQLTVEKDLSKDSKSQLLAGDQIYAIDSQPVGDIFSLYKFIQNNQKETLMIKVVRGQQSLDLSVALSPIEVQEPSGKQTYFKLEASFMGQAISPPPYIERYDSAFAAASYGISEAADKSMMIVKALASLITGNLPLKALGGPMLIAKVAKDAAQAGWEVFFATMAMISINLGVLNLFPIPALDGGQLLLVVAEALRRKPLSDLTLENFQRVGFVMIMALVVLATYNDLSRFWSSMLKTIAGSFN